MATGGNGRWLSWVILILLIIALWGIFKTEELKPEGVRAVALRECTATLVDEQPRHRVVVDCTVRVEEEDGEATDLDAVPDTVEIVGMGEEGGEPGEDPGI